MSDSPARLNVTQHKDIAIAEFTENKILDEMSVADIERALGTLLEAKERPKILLDFANVDHLTSAALGMLININNRIKQKNGQLRLANWACASSFASKPSRQCARALVTSELCGAVRSDATIASSAIFMVLVR